MKTAIFLDKDGTLIPDIPYNVNPSLITLNKGVGEGLSILQCLGYDFIIISNQAGVALNYFTESDLKGVFNKLIDLLKPWNIDIKAFYYCPHHFNAVVKKYKSICDCRKPLPGLINKAADNLGIDLKKSWMIGDILNDVEAGKRAGCRNVLINNGNETEWIMNDWREPDFIANGFLEAAKYIEKVTKTETAVDAKQMAKV